MAWWQTALYDTCSLITLDKLLLEDPAVGRYFPDSILALTQSFSSDQLRQDTAGRMRTRVTWQDVPPPRDLAVILAQAQLPPALAGVDQLIYATAVRYRLPVVTADRRLARFIRRARLKVANMALILRELVQAGQITAHVCERLLVALAERHDFLLGTPTPTWKELSGYKFP